MAQAADWPRPDAETRRRGEQTGLDTRVVPAVNDADSVMSWLIANSVPQGSR